MPADLVLYFNPMSRSRIARWMLEELGEPYEVRLLSYGPDMQSDGYLALNPMGKVPTLVHRGAVVTESAAICAYLADAFPQCGLAPAPGTPEAANYYRWMFFAAGPLESAVTDRMLGVTVPPEREGTVGYGSYDRMVGALERAVGAAPHIAGDRFTAADVYVGSQVGWGLMFGTLPDRPAFRDYWARIKDRPALQRANEASDAEMPKETAR
jgi:glutathione S-transferase